MLLLYETANGLALLKCPDGTKPDEISKYETARRILKVEDFYKFNDMKEATDVYSETFGGNPTSVPTIIKEFLRKNLDKKANKLEKLAIVDQRLGNIIHDTMNIPCIYSQSVVEMVRDIKGFQDKLLNISEKEERDMQIGLAHSLSRYVMRFNSDALDTMIVQSINLLDDIEKEINLYTMRLKEWYGWHFPELVNLLPNSKEYAQAVLIIGDKTSLRGNKETNETIKKLHEITTDEIIESIIDKASTSFGTSITGQDFEAISALANDIILAIDQRTELQNYIKNRMRAIAPTLTALVGEVVGARLLAHAGSITSLARYPASTIQIVGAEKAFFRVVKAGNKFSHSSDSRTKKLRTPKYGIIFHSALVSQQPAKLRGKAARIVSCRAALAVRHDAAYVKQLQNAGLEKEMKELNQTRGMSGQELESRVAEIGQETETAMSSICKNERVANVSEQINTFVERRLSEINSGSASVTIRKDKAKPKKYTEKLTKEADAALAAPTEPAVSSIFVGDDAVKIGIKRPAEVLDEESEEKDVAPAKDEEEMEVEVPKPQTETPETPKKKVRKLKKKKKPATPGKKRSPKVKK